jgi:DNA-binding SARP family transcriptional activator
VDFSILGPLEVRAPGGRLALGGAKQRSLLAVLLLNANQAVSSDRLIEALWGERPPGTAAKALQVLVSDLRKLLEPERVRGGPSRVLLTHAPGYLLELEPEQLDLTRFERLRAEGRQALEAGDPAAASAKLGEALSLWRGGPLADLAYEPFAQAEIGRLEELRLTVLEERIGADLALGRHSELVGELEALVAEHPLRERLRYGLMLALYRSGRQAEALAAYRDAHQALTEELGIEPSRGLRELEQAILNQDPTLDLPVEERPEPQERAGAVPPPPTEPITQEVRKTITAVFVTLTISSAGGQRLDPEALRRLASRAFAAVEAAVEHHGGTVETIGGDAVIAVFGLPVVHEDDALRGVRAGAEIRDALSGLALELAAEPTLGLGFGVGISTGEVIAGGEAGPQLRATGEPLTLSSRLGRAAMPGELLLDEATRRLVRDAVITEAAKDAFRVLRLRGAGRGLARGLSSPMIGRERERRRLEDAFEQAVGDSSCQLFTVLGLAGVGKSRLVREFVGDLTGRALVARGRCLSYGDGITFWPLREAVREATRLEDSDSPEAGRAKLARALSGEEDVERVAQQVAELVGLAEAGGAAEHGFRAVQTLFEALARTQPLVLVFDDIHWGEATFLDLVEYVADSVRDAPILLVCLARPELHEVRPGWAGGKLNATSVLLEPLSEDECGRLIANLVGQADLAEEVESRIVEVAEGNPLFVEEMLAMLIDDGLLVPRDGRWVASGDVSAVRVPPTIQALLAARLDRLGGDERAVIERAAVEGKVFHEGVVARLAPDSLRPSARMHLDALVRKDLIRPARPEFAGERAFRFRHLLIRDAAYDSLPKSSRAQLHELFGRWLEERTADRPAGYEEIIGYHLEQAYRYRAELGPVDDAVRALAREAAERLGAAGSRAFMRRDPQAAVSLISRAVSVLAPDDPARVDLIPNVRVVQGISGDLGWAEAVLTDATAAGDERLQSHALVQRAFLRLFTEPETVADEVVEAGERAARVFERAWRRPWAGPDVAPDRPSPLPRPPGRAERGCVRAGARPHPSCRRSRGGRDRDHRMASRRAVQWPNSRARSHRPLRTAARGRYRQAGPRGTGDDRPSESARHGGSDFACPGAHGARPPGTGRAGREDLVLSTQLRAPGVAG